MATTLEAGRWTKYLHSGTSTPYTQDNGYYYDHRGGLSITYELNSTKTAYNLSITHKIQAKQNVTSSTTPLNSMSVSSYVNGNLVKTFSGASPTGYQTLETKTLGTTTYSVPLNSDGSCSVKIKCIASDGTYSRNWQVTYTLPTVALASTITTTNTSSSNYVDFGNVVGFSITRPNTSTTHTLTYVAGGTTYTIGSEIGDYVEYAFPTSLINSYPSNAYVSIPVTCTNSNGLTSSTIAYIKVPDSYVPSCSLSISRGGVVPESWGIWLKGKSTIKGTITASGIAGSTISSYYTTADGSPYYSGTFETVYLKSSGNVTITSKVTDSRTRSSSASQTISVVDYWTPSLSSFSVVRCNSDGTLSNDGTYGKVKCNYSVAPCNNNNPKQLVVKYGSQTQTFALEDYSGSIEATTGQLFSGLSISSNHNFEFYIQDYFVENTYNFTMTPSFTTISYLAGGKGVSIGQIASEEGFHVHMKTELHDELKLSSGIVLDFEVVDEW